MFFTREDILKIQQALLQLGVKDSELPSAEPVTYDDTLSIVQDGKNKQIGAKDFCNQISLWKREDFINITDKYDKHYISLIEAIDLVPILQRKDGLVITFQDIEGNWEIYQFRGNITEFFEEDKWFNLYDYRNNIIQSIVPDEEDLTVSTLDENGNSLVSLKDRVYDPTSFSGKGYKILRKNIQSVNIAVTKIRVDSVPLSDGTLSFTINGKETQVAVSATIDNTTALVAQKVASVFQESMTEYEVLTDTSLITLTRKSDGSVTPSVFSASTTGVVCTVTDSTKREFRNILTPVMINQTNTIYEIRYDFDLDGKTIEIPDGCTLNFKGGMIRNGKISGYIIISASQSQIFQGVDTRSLSCDEVNVNWFCASVDAKTDNTRNLQSAFDINSKVVLFQQGTYIVSSPIQIGIGKRILGKNGGQFGAGATCIINNNENGGIFWQTNSINPSQEDACKIENLSLIADYPIKFNDERTAIIVDGDESNVPYLMAPKIKNCYIGSKTRKGIGISWSKCFDGVIELCTISGFEIGILGRGVDLSVIRDNRVMDCKRYLICLLSVSTFGSQTTIEHNDLLAIEDGGTMIKCTNGHTRIYNNYLENSNKLETFIDNSQYNCPEYAGQKPIGYISSSFIADNRIDGILNANVAYKLPDTFVRLKVVDSNTTNGTIDSMKIYDSDGNLTDHFKFFFNTVINGQLELDGYVFGKWNTYKTTRYTNGLNSLNYAFFDLYRDFSYKNLYPLGHELYLKPNNTCFIYDRYNFLNITDKRYYKICVKIRAEKDTSFRMVALNKNGSGYIENEINIKAGNNDITLNIQFYEGYNGFVFYTKEGFYISEILREEINFKLITTVTSSTTQYYLPFLKYDCSYKFEWDDDTVESIIFWTDNSGHKYLKNGEVMHVEKSFINRVDASKSGLNIKVYESEIPSDEIFLVNSVNDIDKTKHGIYLLKNEKTILSVINGELYNSNGEIFGNKKGETSARPSSVEEGFEYYDTTLKKKILWNGTAWVNMDGTQLS